MPIRVIVREAQYQLGGEHFDAEFLLEFAIERLARRFVSLDLTAREFPSTGHMSVRAALVDEVATSVIGKQAYGDSDLGRAAQFKRPWQCLYFLPEPQGQGWLRPTLGCSRT